MTDITNINKLIVVPAYNESQNIKKVIEDLLNVASPDQILIINDGSRDNTLEVINSFEVNFIDFPINLGVSEVLSKGFRFARQTKSPVVVQFDGDGQHLALEIEKILAPVLNGECDIAIGVRGAEFWNSSSLPRKIGGKIISRFLKVFTGKDFSDPTSGFRAYSTRAIENFSENFPDEYPEVESIVLGDRMNLSIKEFQVSMAPRLAGRSSITFFGSLYYMIKTLLALVVISLRKY